MSKHQESEDKLERLLNDALRELPLRRAPDAFQSRVLSELTRREALPWWRRSFAHWPAGGRAVFVAVCMALIGSTLMGGFFALVGERSLNQLGALLLSWVQPALAVTSSAAGLAALLVRVIPPPWLYGGLAVGAMLYVILFGLGAAAYRTLYLRPSISGDSL
jgi:hypothetical protein